MNKQLTITGHSTALFATWYIPVHRVLPGQISRDILRQTPING